ncbi:helix-turn-helix domain-containing protein [Corynebacterium durum]
MTAKTLTFGAHRSADSSLNWLHDLHVRRSLDACAEETYGRLLTYGQQHSTDLTHILAAYLHSGSLIAATSELLGIHRHTVRPQLVRVAECCEVDLSSPVVRAKLLLTVITRG